MTKFRPLLASYGAGHANIQMAIARGLIGRGVSPTMLGFTTAYHEFQREGLSAISIEALLEPEHAPWLEAAMAFLPINTHPTVTARQTQAYFAIGMRDLAEEVGEAKMRDMVAERGRLAFEPVKTMRRFLRRIRPSIVVATTSPRFETALLKAARLENIPNLAVGDLFLTIERDWILKPGYAENIAVFNAAVADRIIAEGYPAEGVHITGNPAFDALAPKPHDEARRNYLRRKMRMADKTVILWAAPPSPVAMDGTPFAPTDEIVAAFEALCERNRSFAYIFRRHPNGPSETPGGLKLGRFDDGALKAEDALLISDIITTEVSSMALQAVLRRQPVICLGFYDYGEYAKFGLARHTDTINELIELIETGCFGIADTTNAPDVGRATNNVLEVMHRLARHRS